MKNLTQLIGRIGNIETKKFDNADGTKNTVVNISLAVEDNYYNSKNELVERTQWVNLTSNGKIAEALEKYFSKGDQLALMGKLRSRQYTHPTANIEIYVTEVHITDIVWQASIFNRQQGQQ